VDESAQTAVAGGRRADAYLRKVPRNSQSQAEGSEAAGVKNERIRNQESAINNESLIKDPEINNPDITVVDGLTARHMTP
jgi:hypothetical protein